MRIPFLPPKWAKDDLWTKARKVPSLDLRFADNKSLVDATTGSNLVTFTRASSGTFVGSDGVLRTAVTNLLLRSEEFDNASWIKTRTSVTANAIAAPNGTLTADKIVEDNSSSTHLVLQGSPIAGLAYVYSVYAKAAERSRLTFAGGGFGAQGFAATFDLSSGTIPVNTGNKATIVSVGDGWYRCIVAFTPSNTVAFELYLDNGSTNNYTGDNTSGLYLWGAQLEQSSSVGEYIPTTSTINSAPRFDHNPTTGESLGLLVEEQRTNSIRNNTMVGAVAGTPGTLPTNWSVFTSLAGLTREIVGTGTENGITYIDIKLSGTPSAAGSYFINTESNTQVVAANGQTWTSSAYFKLQAGTTTGLSGFSNNVSPRDLLGNTVGNNSTAFTPTSAALITQRVSSTVTNSSALTAYELQFIQINLSGVAIDITLRIGLPQLEQGAFATSVIPTSTTAVTRSADVASITGSAFSSWYRQDEGTVFAAYDQPAVGGSIAVVDDATTNNAIVLFSISAANQRASANMLVASANQGRLDAGGTFTANVLNRAALAVSASGRGLSCNGSAVSTSANPSSMPTLSRLAIQGDSSFSVQKGGHIQRLTYWPTRLPNPTLQAVTQ